MFKWLGLDEEDQKVQLTPGEHLILKSQARLFQQLKHLENLIMTQDDDLEAAVAGETNGENAVITLLNGISAQLTAANNAAGQPDPRITAAIATMNNNIATMAAAAVANTPAAGAGPATTPPAPTQSVPAIAT